MNNITKEFILKNVYPICEEGMQTFIAYKGSALEYLREDPRGNIAAAYCLRYGNEKIRACREIAEVTLSKSGLAFEFLTESLKSDRKLAQIGITQSGLAFKFLPESLKTDHELAKIAVKQNKWAFDFLPEVLQKDPEILKIIRK